MNKTQRRAAAATKAVGESNQAMSVAMQALDRIESHEKECGERWAEAIREIKYLRGPADAHSARWEKLAWLVVAAVGVHIVVGMI